MTEATCTENAKVGLSKKYKFGFILSTSLGNITRYKNFRKFAELDQEIDFVWAPVKHYISPGERDPFAFFPGPIRKRAIVLYQSAPVLREFGSFDAVMIHMYEVDALTALRSYIRAKPLRIVSSDDAPAVDPSTYPMHPVDLKKPAWQHKVRLKIDVWRARRADLSIPFSRWAGGLIEAAAGVPPDKIKPIHVGLDLNIWRYQPRARRDSGERVKLLFVGGEFERKGGFDLLAAFERSLSRSTELHLVTKTAPTDLPDNVYVHADLNANDERLTQLYRDADIFVHPTRSDLSPWVVLEAMASGCPVVTTRVGGIVDLVIEEETGFFAPVGDPAQLAVAIERLVADPVLREKMGERSRGLVERDFDASINVPAILRTMKELVDQRRASFGIG